MPEQQLNSESQNGRHKIAVITCYVDPNYVRARTLRIGFNSDKRLDVVVVKNRTKNFLRYPEMVWKLLQLRMFKRPDAYIVTFRGQEILPLVLLLAGRRPVVFDELIIPSTFTTTEGYRPSPSTTAKRLLATIRQPFYKRWLRQCRFIIADSTSHADFSARTNHVNLSQYSVVPVATDESIFQPRATELPTRKHKFTVLFYGNTLPLHGVLTMLRAISNFCAQKDYKFITVGGNQWVAQEVSAFQAKGCNIEYHEQIPLSDLPSAIQQADLVLGGPFGNTPQAQHVITIKTYQSLACAIPTIIGVNRAAEEIFHDKQNCLLVPQADPEALATAISWAFTHQDQLKSIGLSGYRLYHKYLSQKVVNERLASLIDQLFPQEYDDPV